MTTSSTDKPHAWDMRQLIALAALLFIITGGIVWWWWSRAKKLPTCQGLGWWPKKALGKKALKAAKVVFDYYKEFPGDVESTTSIPNYEYWRAATKGDYFTWIYTQGVIEYFAAGGVDFPDEWPPCVFDVEGDCGPCVELRTIRDQLTEYIAENPAMGTPKAP